MLKERNLTDSRMNVSDRVSLMRQEVTNYRDKSLHSVPCSTNDFRRLTRKLQICPIKQA